MNFQNIKSILIVDDHMMVRDGLKMMIQSQIVNKKLKILEAETGEEAILISKKNEIDLIIIDYHLPKINGAEAVKMMLSEKPNLNFLALSNSDELINVNDMISSGAKGFIMKNITPFELIKCIETVLSGKPYYSLDIALKLLGQNQNLPVSKTIDKDRLTDRELLVLKEVAKQKSNEEIATSLSISRRTVEQHVHNILEKLQLKNRTNIVVYAIKNKII
ncbi:MAG: response regulator transcription factor [Bacteroidota bacterium]|nr:response regulator transcription factor [Bacteroidota bacterium]